MYRIKPQFELPDSIELPNCIYHQNPVNPTIKVSRSRPASGSTSPSKGKAVTAAGGGGGCGINGTLGTLGSINTNKISVERAEPKPKGKAKSPGGGAGGGKGKMNKQQSPSPSQSKTSTASSSCSSSKTQLLSPDKVKTIEERQLVLINKIESLHRSISAIHAQECAAAAISKSSILSPIVSASQSECDLSNLPEGDFVDIVINADPSRPPFSILFYYKLLQQVYGPGAIVIRGLMHSSVPGDLRAAKMEKYLKAFNNNVNGIDSDKKRIILTVIWKKLNNATEPELILSPSSQLTICGEENMAKFLSRILPRSKFPNLNYDGLEADILVRVNSFLSQTHLHGLDSLEAHLHVLNSGGGGNGKNKLGTVSEFLTGGREPTIADFFMYSHTAHALLVDEILLSKHPNIMKWLWACQQYGGFTVFDI